MGEYPVTQELQTERQGAPSHATDAGRSLRYIYASTTPTWDIQFSSRYSLVHEIRTVSNLFNQFQRQDTRLTDLLQLRLEHGDVLFFLGRQLFAQLSFETRRQLPRQLLEMVSRAAFHFERCLV